jgi:hypothetical protein
MVLREGIRPSTQRLKVVCSISELPEHLVPYARIGLTLVPYHGTVLPLNYKGNWYSRWGLNPRPTV